MTSLSSKLAISLSDAWSLCEAANPLQSTEMTVVIVPKITIWNPAHGILLFVFVSFDVRLITPPSYPGSLTAQSFPIRRISSWRALLSHLVRRYDKRIFFNTDFSHRGLWALHLQLVDDVSLLVHEGDKLLYFPPQSI